MHDLIGRAFLEDAVLVDAGFVGERIASNDGFVPLDFQTGHRRNQTTGRHQSF